MENGSQGLLMDYALKIIALLPFTFSSHKLNGFRVPRSRHRLASISLFVTLLAPACFALWAAIASYQSGVAARRAAELPDLLASARISLSQEESLSRKYRLAPSAGTRVRVHEEALLVVDALEKARALSLSDQPGTIEGLLDAHRLYAASIDAMLAAADAGDPIAAAAIDERAVALELGKLRKGIIAAIDMALAKEAKYDDRLENIQLGVLIATPIVFVLNLALALVLLVIKRAGRRRAQILATREAERMRQSEQRFRALVQNASDVVIISTLSGLITYQSPTAATLWGYANETLIGQPTRTLVHPDDQPALKDLWDQLRDVHGSVRSTELRVRRFDGTWGHVELIMTNLAHEASIEGFVLTARDIEERKAFERQLTQRAFHDALTGLPNRLLFHDRVEQALVRARRRRLLVGLLFIDLDNFKLINDSLGHDAGDQLLIQVAGRLVACGRAEDTVARLGGDEFVVLLDCLLSGDDTAAVADNIGRQFKRPFILKGRDVVVTVSIGVAFGDASQEDKESLLRNADVAMYRAKSNGKGQHVLFDPSMHTDALARLELENDLRRALDNDELRVHYQPIVQMPAGHLVEVEALVRWQHPKRGLLSPAAFINVAEETGLIIPLGRWVLNEACRQAVEWETSSPLNPLRMLSVNLSPRQFQQLDLDREIAEILQRTGWCASRLKLEITEGVIMEDVDRTMTMLGKLKDLGVKLAVDDFGTGYSSLAYLKRLPLDVIKIDQSFVRGIGQNPEDTAIVQAIMSLAKSLNLSVTGEGIETADQAVRLKTMGCDRGQGYFFAKPLDANSITTLLRLGHQSDAGAGELSSGSMLELAAD
jgi:diguanylate cyclase (GGDEF)-like protein/PAS domain S-box-containing protein